MGSTTQVVEVKADGPDGSLFALTDVVIVSVLYGCRHCCCGRLFFVEMPLVLEQDLGLRSQAEFLGDRGHDVHLIVDNDCQSQCIELHKVWE